MRRPAVAPFLAVVTASVLLLAGCGGGSDTSTPGTSDSTSPSTSGASVSSGSTLTPSPYPTGVPASVQLTSPGAVLKIGDKARVAFTAKKGVTGTVEITLTSIEHTSFATSFTGWQLDAATRAKNPYFVHATIRNIGRGTIPTTAMIPLYALDDANTLVEYTNFGGGKFVPCPNNAFPSSFAPGKVANVCLVYLVPKGGSLVGVSFRNSASFDPIVWAGEVTELTSHKPGKGKSGKGASSKGKGGKSGNSSKKTSKS
jgi:hypothetical protein